MSQLARWPENDQPDDGRGRQCDQDDEHRGNNRGAAEAEPRHASDLALPIGWSSLAPRHTCDADQEGRADMRGVAAEPGLLEALAPADGNA